jgi:hypothetical protein
MKRLLRKLILWAIAEEIINLDVEVQKNNVSIAELAKSFDYIDRMARGDGLGLERQGAELQRQTERIDELAQHIMQLRKVCHDNAQH